MTERMTVAQVMAMAPNATIIEVEYDRTHGQHPWAQICTLVGPVTDDEVTAVQRALDLVMIGETWTVKRRTDSA